MTILIPDHFSSYSMKAKALLEAYDIHPPPRIVEVDHRPDMEQIKGILSRLTSRSTWPNIVLKGVSIGGSDDIHALHEKGLLRERLEKAGISLGSEASHYAADGVTRASRKNGKVPENETS
jgi:glutaredoxin 3